MYGNLNPIYRLELNAASFDQHMLSKIYLEKVDLMTCDV